MSSERVVCVLLAVVICARPHPNPPPLEAEGAGTGWLLLSCADPGSRFGAPEARAPSPGGGARFQSWRRVALPVLAEARASSPGGGACFQSWRRIALPVLAEGRAASPGNALAIVMGAGC